MDASKVNFFWYCLFFILFFFVDATLTHGLVFSGVRSSVRLRACPLSLCASLQTMRCLPFFP